MAGKSTRSPASAAIIKAASIHENRLVGAKELSEKIRMPRAQTIVLSVIAAAQCSNAAYTAAAGDRPESMDRR